jgi:predicted alpha/beta hydrolase family esterase
MAAIEDHDLLLIPGSENSGPDHWQSHWARLYPNSTRVVHDDWLTPKLADWVERVDGYVRLGTRPAIIVAHSLACPVVAHWAATRPHGRVVAALLVAVPDLEAADSIETFEPAFTPYPRRLFGFPATIAGSRDDPFGRIERAREFANAWGVDFVDVGAIGHINSASGLGDWPLGQDILARLVGRIGAR